jgi:hypothetical protein
MSEDVAMHDELSFEFRVSGAESDRFLLVAARQSMPHQRHQNIL